MGVCVVDGSVRGVCGLAIAALVSAWTGEGDMPTPSVHRFKRKK
ncbi:hypothetical protein M7I_5450 [Glarea lozoyensis 74030]|uniref:Uncharacterized protein n=1 Tax=Glarea lozoyensis (strain ATCC 74030 / MF5533) TaxID=1104152 RepID=H0ERX8_GLAL7|nr:hypothetical protein M7I_5450 [Glarea lozoyensis 74030]